MGNITLIAAIGINRELGYNNDLIWKIPEDLRFFRDNTNGKYIVMGLNTFNSLPKLLSNRKHIVLTHRDIDLGSSVMIFHSVDELLSFVSDVDEEVMVIGGGMIYSQMIKYANKMLLTEINDSNDCDVYFPKFDVNEWDREIVSSHTYENIDYKHVLYKRK